MRRLGLQLDEVGDELELVVQHALPYPRRIKDPETIPCPLRSHLEPEVRFLNRARNANDGRSDEGAACGVISWVVPQGKQVPLDAMNGRVERGDDCPLHVDRSTRAEQTFGERPVLPRLLEVVVGRAQRGRLNKSWMPDGN